MPPNLVRHVIERGRTDAMLAAQLRGWGSSLCLLEDGYDLTV